MKTHTLKLTGMRFFGHHGVHSKETENGQAFGATVALELASFPVADRLEATVDYTAVHAVVRSVLEGPPRKLIETLAEEVATALLREFDQAMSVEVEVTKPEPPVDFPFEGVSVRVVRGRDA
jgi:dihydroneopterin aldolase